MKFSNGAWTMAPGVRPIYPMRIESVVREPRKLVVRALSTADPSRGASIGGNAFTITLWSPVEGVIGVRVQHHRGARVKGPAFELADRQPDVSVDMDGSSTSFTSGGLTVTLGAAGKPWGLTFSDAEGLLTESPLKALGLMHKDDRRYLREMLTLEVGENVYGLGERFTPFVKNGQVVEIWHDDCGTCSDKAYKNIPFYLSNRGYGVLVNTPDRVVYECGTEHTTRVSFAVESEELEYFVIGGRDPKLVLQRLCELAGKPALPPAWSFGLWLSTSFTTAYDEKSVTAQIEGMRERNLPLHVFHFDCFWMKQSHWVDFTWDPDTFPDPRGMLERLKSRGLHICVWINPYVAELSSLFDEGLEGGYFLKRPNGDVYQRDEWQPNMALVDFTNSAARDWYKSKLRALVRMGVDSFKTDFGEVIPTDVVYHDGSDPERMHNYYTELYNKTVFELLEEELGKGAACVFARSATLGGQKYPVHWGGDCYATFPSMAETLRGGLSLALSGFGFWSHDIGGFEQTADPALYKRWIAFGLLSSHSRLHGSGSYRVPWAYDEESVDVLRRFTELKCRLMPYLFGQAVVAHEQGIPMLRPMLLEFPNDPACATLDRQYMLGESLLVAPVFQKSGEVTYYLPDGIWTHLLTGERRQGGRFYTERYDVFGLPIFLRPNRLLPLGKSTQAVDYDYGEELVLVAGALDASLSQILDLVDSRSTRFAQVIARKAGNELLLDGIRDGAGWELVELGPSGTATVGIDALPSGKRHGLSQRACRLALP